MAVITKATAEQILVLLVGVMLFNGLVFAKVIGPFLKDNPFILLVGAIALLIWADKIAGMVTFLDKLTVRSFLYILASILLFNGLINMAPVLKFFMESPWIVILVSLAVLMFRKKIADAIGG